MQCKHMWTFLEVSIYGNKPCFLHSNQSKFLLSQGPPTFFELLLFID